ncbi:MAG TPA: MFS transporter [Gemmatimonadales bacterium]|nr:MFS transporter [Gemmatimonadales bacterium]
MRDTPKVVWSWALFDWANSAFTTLVVTFIYATYFTRSFDPDPELAAAWWGRAVSISAIVIALLSPVLGAAADRAGARKRFLLITTLVCVAGSAVLAFVVPGTPNAVITALVAFAVANIAFELGNVFYNSFLPEIASPERIGRISGYGWALGYAGGLACMAIALVGFVQPEVPWFGLSKESGWNIRATNLLVAGWFLVFALPLFRNVPEQQLGAVRLAPGEAFRALASTFRELRRYGEVFKFLLARLVYNDGLVTIFAFGGIYAANTFGLSFSQVLMFGVALNVAAGLGAFLFGFVDDRLGGKRTVMLSLLALCGATLLAVWAPNATWLWVAGILIGIFVGPNQSASRSLLARMVPEEKQAEFFGFFAFSGKATSFMAPLLYGEASRLFGSLRAGVATVLVFFVVGMVLLGRVREDTV